MDKTLLQKYIEGNASREEIAQVTEWLDRDDEHVREFMALHKLYDISLFNLPPVPVHRSAKKRHFSLRKITSGLIKIAAIFLLAGASLYFLFEPEKKVPAADYQTIYVPPGQRAELMLPDSTLIWLHSHSRLTYPVRFGKGKREIWLDGEAYMQVTHNKKQPFIVTTEQIQIEVLGTEFNVKSYSGSPHHTEVSLLEGSIRLTSPLVAGSYLMRIQESVRLADGKFIVSPIRDKEYFKWRDGLLCFTNEPMDQILRKLELYYDVRIENQNQNLQQSRYSGKFRTKDGIEQVLRVLQLEHRFTYTKENDLNLITIK